MDSSSRPTPRRPMPVAGRHFDSLVGGADPAQRRELGDRCAQLLIRGANNPTDADAVSRVVRLAETEGIELLGELWADAAPDTLAGALWRLYVLRTRVHQHPHVTAEEFRGGRQRYGPDAVIAGVADPPGPPEVLRTVDEILAGAYRGAFADALFRAAAFAAVCARGRSDHEPEHWQGDDRLRRDYDLATARWFGLANQLRDAGRLELKGLLN